MTPDTLHQDGAHPAPPLRKIRDFRLFWLSRVLSEAGSAVTYVALPVLAYTHTKSPVLVSLVATGEALPFLLFGLFAGAIADRVPRRRFMVTADTLNALCLASLPVAAAFDALTAAHILAAAFLSSTLFLFFEAASYGLIPQLVTRDRLPAANSALWGAETLTRVIGTAAAGALIAVFRPSGVLALDAITFLASAILIRLTTKRASTRDPSRDQSGLMTSIREGLRFLTHHPVLRTMTIVGCLQSFAGGAFMGQLVIFADKALRISEGDSRIGLLYTAWSIGGLAGTIALPRVLKRIDAAQLLRYLLPLSTILGLATVLADDWRIGLMAITGWGMVYLMVLVNTMTYSQQVTPLDLQGRVNTTRRMLSSGIGAPLGALMAGLITTHYGVRNGLVTAVAAAAAATIVALSTQLTKAQVETASREA
nr:MFS transporter [Streptomyces sp. NBC_00857]